MGRYKSLGSLKSFLWYAFQWSRASILFFPILNPLRYTIGSACSGWWQPVFLCFVFPQGSPPGAAAVAEGLMTPTFFVYWYGRWHFSLVGVFLRRWKKFLSNCWSETCGMDTLVISDSVQDVTKWMQYWVYFKKWKLNCTAFTKRELLFSWHSYFSGQCKIFALLY